MVKEHLLEHLVGVDGLGDARDQCQEVGLGPILSLVLHTLEQALVRLRSDVGREIDGDLVARKACRVVVEKDLGENEVDGLVSGKLVRAEARQISRQAPRST